MARRPGRTTAVRDVPEPWSRSCPVCDHDGVPDWTYHPLRPVANAVAGERRTQRAALRFLAALIALPGGARAIPRVFGHAHAPPEWDGRLGAAVPVSVAREAVPVLAVQGASVIEIGPVAAGDVDAVRAAARGRRCRVVARVTDAAVCEALAGSVDEIVLEHRGAARAIDVPDGPAPDPAGGSAWGGEIESGPGRRYVDDPDVAQVVAALRDSNDVILATPALLIAAGPNWFNRVIDAAVETVPPPALRDVPPDPRRWPGWFWGTLVGLGMVAGGLGAALITIGPVLLWYDRDYLGTDVEGLHRINHHLVHFLQHDRITMAGNMIAIGSLYIGLAWGGMRRGRVWARDALLLSGLVGFPTLFYFLGTGFVEPLHVAVAALLFPMFVLAVRERPGPPSWEPVPDGPEPLRLRALLGQLIMIATGIGVIFGGIVISYVGLTDVFVPTDLAFLDTDAATLRAANPKLLPFIAHDRAGFGGALIATGVAITLIGLWGWRRGERWVWWALAGAAFAGSASALIIHFLIHYTAFIHLLPVYIGTALLVSALVLARPFLFGHPRL